MKQLTLRGLEPELVHALRDLAAREGLSLNQAALQLMRKGVARRRIGSSLDRFIGTMSDAEVTEFKAAIAPCEQIDESRWA